MTSLDKKLKKAAKPKPPLVLRPEILLCPNIPKPMHGVAPRVVLGVKWWNAERKKAYKSTSYRCLACGVHKFTARARKWMEGHELYAVDYRKGRMIYVETVPLCHFCHNYIHDGRMLALVEKGEMSHQKLVAVIQHGDRILEEAELKRPTREEREGAVIDALLEGKVAPWSKWRLQIGRKLYKPKFKSELHWKKAIGG